MGIERRSVNDGKLVGPGPFKAKVVGHLDPEFMGGLEVSLLKDVGNDFANEAKTYLVKCASPFAGATNYSFQGQNKSDFNDSQKSYGMFFAPPDVGVTVIVIFINGNPAEGYWIGCVYDKFSNHMVPAIANSENVEYGSDKSKYGPTTSIPVAEVNRIANQQKTGQDIDKIKKAVHPLADKLLEQGLLLDEVRGTSTSTIRRNLPANVYGILTPGPLDRGPNAKKAAIGKKDSKTKPVPVSRLGGTQLVFDDGDDSKQRKTTADKGPPEYVNSIAGGGDVTIPASEYFRVRTRTGHQILMHNSEDLIYIGNAKGTSWIEMSSSGKIDIYAADSISVHTENDMNFFADRDMNFEAGRNINFKSAERYQTEVGKDFNLIVKEKVGIDITQGIEATVGKDVALTITGGGLDVSAGKGIKLTAKGGDADIKVSGATRITAGGAIGIGAGGVITQSGTKINLNSGAAPAAAAAKTATKPVELTTYSVVVTDGTLTWSSTQYKSDNEVMSIMKRVPMHEPWPLHENLDPLAVAKDKTDREV